MVEDDLAVVPCGVVGLDVDLGEAVVVLGLVLERLHKNHVEQLPEGWVEVALLAGRPEVVDDVRLGGGDLIGHLDLGVLVVEDLPLVPEWVSAAWLRSGM